jgi:glycosyltransferase involved in cell wall biosynthesis
LLVNRGDVKRLSEAMLSVLHSPDLARALSREARARACSAYHEGACVEDFLSYASILVGSRCRP